MVAKRRIQQVWLAVLLWMCAAAPSSAQLDTAVRLSPDLREVTLDSCLRYIRNCTGFKAIYSSSLTVGLRPITYYRQNVPLHRMLDTVLGRLGLGYTFSKDFIRLYMDAQLMRRYNKRDTLTGKVVDENGNPLGGVSVHHVGADRYAITSWEGIFILPWPQEGGLLEFTHIAHENKRVQVRYAGAMLPVTLKPSFGATEEVVIMAYHDVSRRNNTASSYRLRGQELNRGSVNVFRELSGKVPGLFITEASGAPGAASRIQIRGRQSIGTTPGVDNQPFNDPLILLNKVPLVTGNRPVTLLPSAAGDPRGTGIYGGGISAQAAINAEDIETIDVLKDADATAIYGSRGAHGAILITTKSGKLGNDRLRVNVQTGAVTSTYVPALLDNREYTAMRKEAFNASAIQPSPNTAPDLFLLDTNNYINIPQLLAGGAGRLTNIHASFQGENALLRYYVSAGFYRETSVMPAPLPQQRFTSHANIRYRSPGRRLQADVSLLYSSLNYNSLPADPLLYTARLVPLLPSLRDEDGNLLWEHNGFPFINPLGQFQNSSSTRINTFTGSWQGSYWLLNNLYLRTTLGYQWLPVQEELKLRQAAGYPEAEIWIAGNGYNNVLAEPRLEYEDAGDESKWGIMLGATYQEKRNRWTITRRTGYTSDAMLDDPALAAQIAQERYASIYRYLGTYGRWHASWRNRYFINATGRFDISSRFGPARKMAFFGALGAAWIFSAEKWFRSWQWLTHGKLRGSYGTAGNDNIDDYTYLETWTTLPGALPYDSINAYHPNRQPNSMLGWEFNRKLEFAMELEMERNLFFSVAWYRNVTSDQFITANIPDQAGPIGNLVINAPAKVLNTGWEFSLRTSYVWKKDNSYTTTLVLTLPRNRLQSFPGLETSAYNTSLVVGQPLSVQRGYPYQGVDVSTGLFITTPADTIITGHWEPQAYAGWSQEWRLGRFRIALFLEARKQMALDPLYYTYANVPGRWLPSQMTNLPRTLLQRWHQPGDQAFLQRFTAANTASVQQAIQFFRHSGAMVADASFWRIRSLYGAWELPARWQKWGRLCEARIYLQAQNLFTRTAFRDGDPTIQYTMRLSATRTITAGLQVSF